MTEFWKSPKKSIYIKKFPFYSGDDLSIDINDINPEFLPHFSINLLSLAPELIQELKDNKIKTIGDLLITPRKKLMIHLKNDTEMLDQIFARLRNLLIFHKVYLKKRYQKLKFNQKILSFRKLVGRPASLNTIKCLPIFNDLPPGVVHIDDMHPSYKPKDDIFKLLLNKRSENVLNSSNCKTIFDLLMTPLTNMAIIPNCGYKTVVYIQKNLIEYILRPKAENISNWNNIEDMLDDMLKGFKEVDVITFKRRIGLNQERVSTLQQCGDMFGMSREAARQKVDKIFSFLLHPVTKTKMSKFWNGIERTITEHRIIRTEDLCRAVKLVMAWSETPETHVIESLVDEYGKYLVTGNSLISKDSNKEIHCEGFHKIFYGLIRYYGYPYEKIKKSFISTFKDTFTSNIANNEELLIRILEYNLLYKTDKYYVKNNKLFDKEKTRRKRRVL